MKWGGGRCHCESLGEGRGGGVRGCATLKKFEKIDCEIRHLVVRAATPSTLPRDLALPV